MNQVQLTGQILEAQAIRYTPAGVAMLDMLIAHHSEVEHAEHTRTIEMEMRATASGDMALLMAEVALGEPLWLQGFLAPSRKGSSRLVLHIQKYRRLAGDPGMATV
ncbi:MAG TPA: primosomal replication protein N [Burkholderiaceae bacterium]|nr:primosomal replication protein N [Burkholderiaceae bacterium]